jgi:GT2 family glycosyltransferase
MSARPRWSVMVPTFETGEYLREALAGVLAQDPGAEQMQIAVVDDHSVEHDPAALARELGRGRIEFHRAPVNRGHVANFNACITLARGELVHVLHGDDLVYPGFYARLGAVLDDNREAGAAWCRYRVIDGAGREVHATAPERPEPGIVPDAATRIASRQPIQPPAMVVRRDVYERLGGFDSRMRSCGEDWEMWVRIATAYPVAYEPSLLAAYRRHPASLTARALHDGGNLRDLCTAIAIYRRHLPPGDAAAADAAYDVAARWGLTLARELAGRGGYSAATAQVLGALRTARSWRMRARAAGTGLWLARRRLFVDTALRRAA